MRVDPADESEGLRLHELDVHVLRVRHPLPACERVRVVRPEVVVIGSGLFDADVDLLQQAAREAGCATVDIDAYVSKAALRDAIRRAVARAGAVRTEDERIELNGTAIGRVR